MRFDRLEGYLVRLPLKKPLRVSNAPTEFCETVLFRIESGGVSGWGEVAPGNSPILTEQWSGATYLTARDVILPLLTEAQYVDRAESFADIFASIKGNRQARGVAEMAWQDLNARLRGEPLWKTLGGEKKPLKVGLTFDRFIEEDEFFNEMKRATDENFARLTLKIRPGWNVQILNFARLDTPSWLQLQVDVEGGLDFEKHSDTLFRMDDFFLNCVEQPLPAKDFVAHAMLKESMRTPICLDESIESLEDATMAFDLEACRVVCLKPGRVGGHWEARRVAEFAASKEIGCYAGFDLQTSLGYRHLAALASTSNFVLPTDYQRLDEILAFDPVAPLAAVEVTPTLDAESQAPPRPYRAVELWDEPGVGADPDLEGLAPYILDKFEWTH